MKKILSASLLLLFFSLSFAQQKDNKQLSLEFDQLLSSKLNVDQPGATVLVARNGEVVYKKAFGMADMEQNISLQPDKILRIGSLTKQFTAIAILQLLERGKLDLQDPITKFIPDYPMQGETITIEHLLTHTSGIQSFTNMKDYTERMSLDMKPNDMIDHFKNEPMRFAPGAAWSYNNSGYFLLGYIIEQVTGKTYKEYLEENIFKPAEMYNTVYGTDIKMMSNRVPGYSRSGMEFEKASLISMTQPYAAGAIESTVEDLFKWHTALYAGKLVKKESLKKAFTKYMLSTGNETDYGYGFTMKTLNGSPTIQHGGAINGFKAMQIYLPKENIFVAVLSNCECRSAGDIAAKLATLAMGN